MYGTKLMLDDEGLNKVSKIEKKLQSYGYLFWGMGVTLTTMAYPVELTFKLKGARTLTASK